MRGMPRINVADVLTMVREPHPGIYVVDLLRPVACARLLHVFDEVKAEKRRPSPNSMNRYGLPLDERFDRWLRHLMNAVVKPITQYRRCPIESDKLRHTYGFVVDYKVGQQRSLASHVDSSDMTMNLCLGRTFEGGKLVFIGPRGGTFELRHRPGTAVIHAGNRPHKALPITDGHRQNLILWCSKSVA